MRSVGRATSAARRGRAGSPPGARSGGWCGRRARRSAAAAGGRRPRRCWGRRRTRSPRRARGSSPWTRTSPARRIRNSSSENCRGVSATGQSPRQTWCAAGSRRRSPTSSTTGALGRPRRSSARSRASSTTYENGLARKSSAPASRARASSSGPERAVSIRIGVQSPSARRRAHSSSPASFGQHHVEHQGVVGVLGRQPLALDAVEGHVDGVPLALQPAAQRSWRGHVVLDDAGSACVPASHGRAEAALNRG